MVLQKWDGLLTEQVFLRCIFFVPTNFVLFSSPNGLEQEKATHEEQQKNAGRAGDRAA
jgi:hypothetical protein